MLSCRECKNDARAICFFKYFKIYSKPKMPENHGNLFKNIVILSGAARSMVQRTSEQFCFLIKSVLKREHK